ncbi:MAG: sugar ABC transporter ATP-binding protein [Alphaproteobacteria bacterium]
MEGILGHLLQTAAIAKSYGANRVLFDIDFTLDHGESVAVIGENGAGKSTFAKILTGVIRPDEGKLCLDDEEVEFHSPRDALRSGLAFIPQELAYVPDLTVAENVLLGQWPSRFGLTTGARMLAQARVECERFDIDIDVRRTMRTLKLAERQIVEIVKALARRARLIILDEPTASLSEHESQLLFRILGRLTASGVGVIYISHRMDEVYRFSDRVDVLRNGTRVASLSPARTTPAQLITHMLGQEKEDFTSDARQRQADEQAVLQIRGWRRDGLPSLRGIDLSVGREEIVGLYGLRGSGADLVGEGLAGLHRDIQGEIALAGAGTRRQPFATPLAARHARIAFVPAERKRDGLVLVLSIQRNLGLMIYRLLSRFGVMLTGRERRESADLAARFDVRCQSLDQSVESLSGGNQQKVMLASRLAAAPRLLVLQEPTRGVDVGARVEIHRFLTEIARRGCATLLVTSDVEEAVAVSDRLLIMREGRIVGELAGPEKTQANAIALAAGGAKT